MVNRSDLEIVKFIIRKDEKAETEKNELGKTPVDYWRENGSDEKIGKLFRNFDGKFKISFWFIATFQNLIFSYLCFSFCVSKTNK